VDEVEEENEENEEYEWFIDFCIIFVNIN
jgi:hypothetical protein